MKKLGLLLAATVLISIGTMAQKAEVLYFKAELPCCPGRACNDLEADVKAAIEKNFKPNDVVFKQVRIADDNNKPLVDNHKARSQTVVIVAKNGTTLDISDIVRNYNRSKNKVELENNLLAKINETIK